MADAIGRAGSLHDIDGYTCDLCGEVCDSGTQELNALDCTFDTCPIESAVYHQDCLEKYLKSIRLEKNRKTGFKCPRGCGKATRYDKACPGKIDKSHPIISRNENSKKRRKAKAPEVPVMPPKYGPAAKAAAKEAKLKAEKEAKVKAEKEAKVQAEKDAKEKARQALQAKEKKKAEAKGPSREALAAAAAAARRELGQTSGISSKEPDPPRKPARAVPQPSQRQPEDDRMYHRYQDREPEPAPSPLTNAWGSGSRSDGPAGRQGGPSPPPASAQPSAWPTPQSASGQAPASGTGPAGYGQAPAPPGPGTAWQQQQANAYPPPQRPAPPGVPQPQPTPMQQQPQGQWQQQPGPAGPGWGRPVAPGVPAGPGGVPPGSSGWALAGDVGDSLSSASASQGAPSMTEEEDVPVGMLWADDGSAAAKSKAQKKNEKKHQKRLEKRAAEEAKAAEDERPGDLGEGGDPLVPRGSHPAPGDVSASSVIHDHCVQVLRERKALHYVAQMVHLGFPEGQSMHAVHAHGCDLESALAWLLEGHAEGLPEIMIGLGAAPVDISDELAQLAELECLGFPLAAAEQATIDAGGDIQAAVSRLFEQQDLESERGQGMLLSGGPNTPPQREAPMAGGAEVAQSLRSPPPGFGPPPGDREGSGGFGRQGGGAGDFLGEGTSSATGGGGSAGVRSGGDMGGFTGSGAAFGGDVGYMGGGAAGGGGRAGGSRLGQWSGSSGALRVDDGEAEPPTSSGFPSLFGPSVHQGTGAAGGARGGGGAFSSAFGSSFQGFGGGSVVSDLSAYNQLLGIPAAEPAAGEGGSRNPGGSAAPSPSLPSFFEAAGAAEAGSLEALEDMPSVDDFAAGAMGRGGRRALNSGWNGASGGSQDPWSGGLEGGWGTGGAAAPTANGGIPEPAAALFAAANITSDEGDVGVHSNVGVTSSVPEDTSELNALLATLMCR